ncbi:hypothetical protein chiPu_0033260, partial [Chiloscyllium punctatum]|nr:hypothetical protein [Chiloscyllium punctatum]
MANGQPSTPDSDSRPIAGRSLLPSGGPRVWTQNPSPAPCLTAAGTEEGALREGHRDLPGLAAE